MLKHIILKSIFIASVLSITPIFTPVAEISPLVTQAQSSFDGIIVPNDPETIPVRWIGDSELNANQDSSLFIERVQKSA